MGEGALVVCIVGVCDHLLGVLEHTAGRVGFAIRCCAVRNRWHLCWNSFPVPSLALSCSLYHIYMGHLTLCSSV